MKQSVLIFLTAVLLTACQETMDERCMREAKEYTEKNCPALVTEGVTIDSLVFQPTTRTLIYYYTVKGIIDDAEALKQHDFRSTLLKELKNSTSMKTYKEYGYNFRYVYYSTKRKGDIVFDTTFKKKDYR